MAVNNPDKVDDNIQNLPIMYEEPATAIKQNENIDCNPKVSEKVIVDTNISISKTKKIYYPKSQNSLFWAVFIGHYGLDEYNMVRNRITREMEDNHQIVNYFKTAENKTKLKQTNIKMTNAMLQELMADVMTNAGNVVQKGLVYSVYYNTPIYIVKESNRTYLKYIPNEMSTENTPIVIYYSHSNKSFGVNVTPEEQSDIQTVISDIQNNYICLENHNKPLKGISSYKVCDLDEMAQKLNIEKHLKKSKPELYQYIHDYMVW
jgi:hypothetical protein